MIGRLVVVGLGLIGGSFAKGLLLVGQGAEMGRAEDRAAADSTAVGGAIAAEVAEIGAALQRHDMG